MKSKLLREKFRVRRDLAKTMLVMRLTVLLVIGFLLNAHGKGLGQTITWSGKNVSLEKVFSVIKKQTGYFVFYNEYLLKNTRKVDLSVENESLELFLQLCLKDQPVDYLIEHKTIVIVSRQPVLPGNNGTKQEITDTLREVKGKVENERGEPLAGASVVIAGSKTGVSANAAGEFIIRVPQNKNLLIISSVGYEPLSITVDETANAIVLKAKITKTEDIVVIGYGSVKKSDVTGAVSSISKKDLGDRQAQDLATLITGKASGVDVSQGSIRIRGVTTFNNTDPLIIIDGFIGGNLTTVNAADIENIEILKDASATAIYGSRGANGVILITTRSGKVGPLKVNLLAFTGWASTSRKLDVLNASQYTDYATDAMTNAGSPIPPRLLTPESRMDLTNWQNTVFQNGPKSEIDLSLSGGSENVTNYFSMGYQYNEAIRVDGPINNNLYFRGKNDFNIAKWVRVGDNIALNFNKSQNVDLSRSLISPLPYIPVYDSTNKAGLGYGDTDNTLDGTSADNPMAYASQHHLDGAALNYQANVWGELEPVKGLVYRIQAGLSGYYNRTKTWNPDYVAGGGIQRVISSVNDVSAYEYTPSIEQYITYKNKFGNNDVSIMVGNSYIKYGEDGGIGIYGTSFSDMTVLNVLYATSDGVLNETYNKSANNSYFGRFSYGFKNKYLLTFNFRADGSPNFAPDNRWGYFPSIALAWKMQEEKFIKDLNIFSDLKLRLSYGKSGNDRIGDFMYLEKVWNTNVYYQLGPDNNSRANGATVIANASGNIKWESTITKDIGLDMGFLQNSLTVTADYFIKNTNDILFGVPRPPSLGYGSNNVPGNAIINAASCENKGFELAVGYRGRAGKFGYSLNANYTYIDNKVTSLGLGQPYINSISTYGGSYPVSRTDVGNPIGYFYGFKAEGIFKTQKEVDDANATAVAKGFAYYQEAQTAAGDVKFADLNGDGHVDYNSDRTNIGSPIPLHYYGFSATLDYSGFDLNIQLQGVAGSTIMNGFYVGGRSGTVLINQQTNVLGRWKSEADPGNGVQPRAVIGDPSNNNRPSTLWLSNGDYLRVRLLSFGYTLPGSTSSKIGLERLRVYCSLENFFTFTKYNQGYDPDINAGSGNLNRGIDGEYNVAHPKSIVFGLQVAL